ncbi:transglycosylase SLT domain-containing protein [Roseomonas gilardii]|uniref:transglycosylase SLT domain-containing protein n=1 Tax=Roseomonas gilardii TaxID=257708 RepID=UPI0004B454A9|nr:transglycosylase SLT domain-containing protein [Roseomonas gilardii]SUE43306.1 Transglycosylase SLT domain [Roseomonas gilardii subsp. rosea]
MPRSAHPARIKGRSLAIHARGLTAQGVLMLAGGLLMAAPAAQAKPAESKPPRTERTKEAGSPSEGSPRAACLSAAREAEARNGLPEGLLVAVALAESGLHAYALNIGGRSYFPDTPEAARRLVAGARPSQPIMAGCVQVNARVHAARSDWPLNPARATDWAARHLRAKYDGTGDWGDAIRAWNGGSPRTRDELVCRVQAKLQVTNPASRLLEREQCGTRFARDRRSGEALLEVAEAGDR